MSKNKVQDLVKMHCKLYKGGANNTYNPEGKTGKEYTKEYLRQQIWDAEYSVVSGYNGWLDLWQRKYMIQKLSKADTAEEVYKLAVRDKLMKMQTADPSKEWLQMYFEL